MRFQKRLAEPDVRQPGFFQVNPQRQMVKLRSLIAIRSCHASRKQRHLKPESAQQCSKSAVQFIAKSAAAKGDDFVQNCRFVDRNFSAEMNIEILERYCPQMRTVKSAEICRRRISRA